MDQTLATNLSAMFHLEGCRAPYAPGAAIIGSSSMNFDMPLPTLLPYNATGPASLTATRDCRRLRVRAGVGVRLR
jgi:hypothetical protein